MKQKRSVFSPELLRQVEEAKAQADRDQELYLDFDPILNSQDPDQKYVVGNIAAKGDTYWVEVHGVSASKKSKKPDVVAEMALKDRRWVFVNFHYPGSNHPANENLLSILRYHR